MNTHDALISDIHKDLMGRNLRPDQHHKTFKRILLTGGAGFIGSALVRKLVLNYPEYFIVVVDKLDYCSSLNNLYPFLSDTINTNGDPNGLLDAITATPETTPVPPTPSSDSGPESRHRRGKWRSNPAYPNFVYLYGDITDADFIDSIMADYRINTVLHLAAQTHVDKSFGESIDFTVNNVLGTHVLLEAARKYFSQTPSRTVLGMHREDQYQEHGQRDDTEEERMVDKRFIFVSTDEVYGEVPLGQPDCKEDAVLAASNPYSATKAAAECMVQAYHKSFKLPVIITRSNNVYGPFQYPEKIIPKFIMNLIRSNPPQTESTTRLGSAGEVEQGDGGGASTGHCYIHGSGQHSRTYLYVLDAANALDVILHRGTIGEVYNIGSGFEMCNIEVAQDLIHRLVEQPGHKTNLTNGAAGDNGQLNGAGHFEAPLGVRLEKANCHQSDCRTCDDHIEFVEDRAFNDLRYAVDASKLHGLGWSPRIGYQEGIVKTIEWSGTRATDPDPMDNNQGTSLQHQQQGLQQQMQHQQQQQRPGKKRADRPLPAVYKIQLHLRKGEPLERRRLTHGLPDPDPYDHVRGQDSFVVLRERIVTRVSRHPELLWPDDSFPYIKPSESIPQKYYQQLSADNYENLMEKAWQMEAKRLPDEGLIVLNIFGDRRVDHLKVNKHNYDHLDNQDDHLKDNKCNCDHLDNEDDHLKDK
ncbi:hypothetical protein BGX29_008860 [Mortierella sp. GBA35]|nr:hypothetical protein BGX29_008860 [Mortierella sp. GBA35]